MENLSTTYNPQGMEDRWYQYWLDNGYFKAGRVPEAQPYTIVIPPPNVTGKLHIGHAFDLTLQDTLIRWKRMQGFDALWVPGTDHAGIATQAKVEQHLRADGISRYDLGREKFLDVVWDWKHEYAKTIREQWAKMGCSLDYSRERFTLDEGLSLAVRKVFVDLFDKGLIFRGKRIINWDPQARTALSDIEVIYKEVKGALYHLAYPLKDGSGSLIVATTRPETMLGDTAVAVHPDDERYQEYIGKTLILPIVGREIPVVADEYVEREFGSGAVKITPAHDPNDFEVGKRHDLPQITVMNEDGTMNAAAGPYEGMDRFEARRRIVEDLKASGVLVRIEEHVHQVGHSERTDAVVEPYLSTQWFVRMKPLAEAVVVEQRAGRGVQFVPERFEKIYLHWMDNIRDWTISRQLWWGHRIPAWYNVETGEVTAAMDEQQARERLGTDNIRQDEDVLDTWFSSALWPFSTLGWPDENAADMKRYFPTDVLVTGHEIIGFWVARMIFQSFEFNGKMPFRDVLIHGIIRDDQGRKMSKSLGNGVDPMEVIAEYGADALRFMLATGATMGQDMRYRTEKVEQTRNFANKIWNASRFALMNVEGVTAEDVRSGMRAFELGSGARTAGGSSTAERWILHRLNVTVRDVTKALDGYDFGEAGRLLQHFIWDDLCDWYIEFSKLNLYGEDAKAKQMTQAVLVYTLDQTMRLLHPFMPFITEEIWHHLPHEGATIMLAAWPTFNEAFVAERAEREMTLLMDVITAVRNIRAEVNVPPSRPVEMLLKPANADVAALLESARSYIERFCKTSTLTIDAKLFGPDKAMTAVVTGAELYLPLAGLIDIEQELARLGKELKTLEGEVTRIEKKLGNAGFVAKAPAQVVETERAKMADYAKKRDIVAARIAELS
jgi:valyl-tRNA synthetase